MWRQKVDKQLPGQGAGENGEHAGYRTSFGGDENALELEVVVAVN